MLQKNEIGFREFQNAVNQAALVKSEFYTQVREEIKEAIARTKNKIGPDGKPIYEGEDAVMIENTTDEMIAAIFSIGMRGSKIGQVQDRYISRIERGAYYSRVLEKYGDTKRFAEHLKERTRIDVAVVVKNILPDLTRMQTTVFPEPDPGMMYAGRHDNTGGYPQIPATITQAMIDAAKDK